MKQMKPTFLSQLKNLKSMFKNSLWTASVPIKAQTSNKIYLIVLYIYNQRIMSNFVDRVKERAGNTAHVLVNSDLDQHYPVVEKAINGKVYNMLESSELAPNVPSLNHRRSHLRSANPSSLNQNFETIGAENEFILYSAGKRAIINEVYADIILSNSNSGGTTTMSPAELWFQEYSLYANNQTQLLERKYGWDMWLDNYVNLGAEGVAKYGSVSSTSTAWAGGSTIATTSTARYRIRLGGPWNYGPFYLGWFKNLVFKFKQAGTANSIVTDGTGGSVTFSQFQLSYDITDISPHEAIDLEQRTKTNAGLAFRFVTSNYHRESQTLANSTNYRLPLNSIRGIACAVNLLFRQAETAASNGNIKFEAVLDQYQIHDGSGSPIFPNAKNGDETLYLDSLSLQSSMFTTANRAPYIHQFVNGAQYAIQQASGTVLGYDSFDNCELVLDTNTVPSGNTFIIDVVAKIYNMILIGKDGDITVVPS
jgi:hypothetical protein